jgi:prepilin-type N-terminal cleavage/methylation domain-containing protein
MRLRRQQARAAFTLLEILIVVMVIGLLATMVAGGFTNVIPAGREAAAVNKARIVNAARITYALTMPDSAAQWSAALTDNDRSTLLVNAEMLTGTPTDWLSAAGGYTLSLSGTLKAKTVLRDKSGNVLNYPD